MATSQAIKDSVLKSVNKAAARKGSQRIQAYAKVDGTQYVPFFVPEWFVSLNPEQYKKVETVGTNDILFVPKKPTKKAETTDENLKKVDGSSAGGTTTSATGSKNVRESAPNGKDDDDSGTRFIGKKVKLYFSSSVEMKRGDKAYNHKSIRVPNIMNSRAILYFIQKAVGKEKVVAFSLGKTKYPTDVSGITAESLGTLASKNKAQTAK